MHEHCRFLVRLSEAQVGYGHVLVAASEAHPNGPGVEAGGQLVAKRAVQHRQKKVLVGLARAHEIARAAHGQQCGPPQGPQGTQEAGRRFWVGIGHEQ